MKRTPRIMIVCTVFFFSVLACTLPGSEPAQEFPPTPNATMTELYAQATILTPAIINTAVNTFTPIIVAENTATPTVTAVNTQTVTATLAPTRTFTPLPTFTPSTPQREGGIITAKYLDDAPMIDGGWGEWTTTQYGANYVVFGADKWENSDDLEAAYRIGWDENRLYVAVKVRDDKYVQNETGADLYKGDSIELLLDVDLYGDYYTAALNSDDYQLGISPGLYEPGGEQEAYLWFPSNVAGTRSKVVIAAFQEDGLYRVEFSIPWSLFGVTPSAGKHFGFAVSVSDNDSSSKDVQQTMVSSAAKRWLADPTTWGELKLVN